MKNSACPISRLTKHTPDMMDSESIFNIYFRAIRTHFPDLPVESISFLGERWANWLCLVNNALIFRFLVDLEKQQIAGVLDFASISIGDSGVDIAPEIQPYYRGRIDPGWDFRRDYYQKTGALEDLLYIQT